MHFKFFGSLGAPLDERKQRQKNYLKRKFSDNPLRGLTVP